MRRVPIVIAVLLAAITLALFVGQPVSLSRALHDPASIDRAILLHVRLPRVLLGAVAGAGLASTGAAFQALLRNPLAEPYVLGVAGGAALGASLAIALGAAALVPALGTGVTSIAAAIGGIGATILVYAIAARAASSSRGSATSILLAGVVVNAIAGAAITFVKTLVRATTAQQLLFWLAGFLDVPATGPLVVVTVVVALGSAVLLFDAARLNLLALGDEQAAHLGLDVRALERRVFVASSLVVGAIVATCGTIGFVGLLAPHLVRRVVGADHRASIPGALVGGAAMLVLCDAAARALYRWLGTEPPVGAITALVGGPLFLVLLARRAKS